MSEESSLKVAARVGERFVAPRPAFTAPGNADYTIIQEKDNTPAKSLVQQAKDSGNDKLAALIAKAQEDAKLAAKRAEERKAGKPMTVQKRKERTVKAAPTVAAAVQGEFGPEDVCDDRTFIIRTRSGDFHTDEMKRLFWANGGLAYMKAGLSYASAFTNMRTDKLKSAKR